jgi:hypothetical protein
MHEELGPIVQHPEPVLADVIVRVQRAPQPNAPALITPVGGGAETTQSVPATVLARLDGGVGYFRARRIDGQWVIGEALTGNWE